MNNNRRESPDRGQYDPGWNDPPTVECKPSTPGQRKLNLNKRVAFPLHGELTSKPTAYIQPSPFVTNTNVISQPPIAIVPPMMNRSHLSSTNSTTNMCREYENNISESGWENCLKILQNFAVDVNSDEVSRGIDNIKQLWIGGRLPVPVQLNLMSIANALQDKKYSDALEIHRVLIADYSSISSSWSTAIREIILKVESFQNKSSIRSNYN